MLGTAVKTKRFEYSSFGKELKAQADIANIYIYIYILYIYIYNIYIYIYIKDETNFMNLIKRKMKE